MCVLVECVCGLVFLNKQDKDELNSPYAIVSVAVLLLGGKGVKDVENLLVVEKNSRGNLFGCHVCFRCKLILRLCKFGH